MRNLGIGFTKPRKGLAESLVRYVIRSKCRKMVRIFVEDIDEMYSQSEFQSGSDRVHTRAFTIKFTGEKSG